MEPLSVKEKAREVCLRALGFSRIGALDATPLVPLVRRHAPDVDGEEQEQPYHINKVPVPSRRLKTNVAFWGEIPSDRTDQADSKKDRTNDDVHTVETCGHEEGRKESVAAEDPVMVPDSSSINVLINGR